MRKIILFITLLLSVFVSAQNYKYLNVKNGLSNRRVLSIEKDKEGYMWFLTIEGVDRYDGYTIKHYNLDYKNKTLNSILDFSWLITDNDNNLYEIGKRGYVFKYDSTEDEFKLVYRFPSKSNNLEAPILSTYFDHKQTIWLCGLKHIYLYDVKSGTAKKLTNPIQQEITSIAQLNDNQYLLANHNRLFKADLIDNKLIIDKDRKFELPSNIRITETEYCDNNNLLIIGTLKSGIYTYNLSNNEIINLKNKNFTFGVNCIVRLDKNNLLIGSNESGIFQLDLNKKSLSTYLRTDYNDCSNIPGNTIKDIYVDRSKRLWISVFPMGVTIQNNLFPKGTEIQYVNEQHSNLVNNQVNSVIEDHNNDLWYATNNGISLEKTKRKKWETYLSSFNEGFYNKNHIFLSLCEVTNDIIWAVGHSSTIYEINKISKETKVVNLKINTPYIQDKNYKFITKGANGRIWICGEKNILKVNPKKRTAVIYDKLPTCNVIAEKNNDQIWLGTSLGLYLLNHKTRIYHHYKLPENANFIYSLFQDTDSTLYIGTNCNGLILYKKNRFKWYNRNNSSLISQGIHTILKDKDDNIILSTENGLSRFYTQEKCFKNYSTDQGLITNNFNAMSGTRTKDGLFIFGSANGIVKISEKLKLKNRIDSKIVFEDLYILYKKVNPKTKDSPLSNDINQTKSLTLKYDQNIFSIKLSNINYDNPSGILYRWKLSGFYDSWNEATNESNIHFTNLNPGKYKLYVQSLAKENKHIIEERTLYITILPPIWKSWWAITLYLFVIFGAVGSTARIIYLKHIRKISNQKIDFFINTAHDIHTPLTLIKAPLEEIRKKEKLSAKGGQNLYTAEQNVEALLRLTDNLLNFEEIDIYNSDISVSEHELNAYVREVVHYFESSAERDGIKLTFTSSFDFLKVWIDLDKVSSILKGVLAFGIKDTKKNNSMHVHLYDDDTHWSINFVYDCLSHDLKKDENTIEFTIIKKLILVHKGKLNITLSDDNNLKSITISFLKNINFGKLIINNTEYTQCKSSDDWKFINKVKSCIEENLADSSFNVDALCAEMNMSRTSFYHKIKNLTRQAPGDFLRSIKLNRAAELLAEKKYTVSEISEMTGFSDPKYFREVFKKHFHVSPSKYNKQKN